MKRFLIVLLIALPVLAQHRVARIEVNSRVPSRILLTQSALVEGRTYTEADLEVAVARLRRLPFVYDARYRLDGETLILDVEAMSRFFGELDAEGLGFERQQTGSATFAGGGRLFLGAGGVAEAGVRQHVTEGSDGQSFAAQYSHYGIGGSRFFATAGIQQDITDQDGVDIDPQLRLTAGYPLTLRSTITASVLTSGFEARHVIPLAPRPLVTSAEQRLINLRYTYNTSDDPYFARRGLLVSGGPAYWTEKSQFEFFLFPVPDGPPSAFVRSRTEGTFTELAADATKFWPVRERGTFFGTARVSYGHREFDTVHNDSLPLPGEVDTHQFALAAGYGHNLFDRSSGPGTTRQRLEFTIGAARSSFDQNDEFFGRSGSFDTTSLNAAYVLRRQFATVRLNLRYTMD